MNWGILWTIFLLGFLINAPFFSQYAIGLHDEGVVALGAERILNGEIPYRDWDSRFPPGSYVITAFSFLIFGVNLYGLRIVMLLTGAALGALTYLLARHLVPEQWARLSTTLVLIGVVSQISILSYHLVAIIFFLAGILGLCEWSQSHRRAHLVSTGAALAGACFTLQTEAAALLGTCILVLAFYRKKLSQKDLLLFLGAWLGISLLIWSWVLVLSSPYDVWRDNVLNALGLTRHFNNSPFNLTNLSEHWWGFAQQWQSAPLTASVLLWATQTVTYLMVWSLEYALFFPLLLVLIGVVLKKGKETAPPVLICLTGLLLFTFISRHRLDLLYLKYLTPLWYILSVWLIHRFVPWRKWVGGALAVLFALYYGFLVRDSLTYTYPIHTTRGTLYTNSQAQAESTNYELALLSSVLKPGQQTLFYPYACAFYFWGQYRNAIRPPVLVPSLYSQGQFQEAREALEQLNIPTIVHFPLDEQVFEDYPKLDRALFLQEYKLRFEMLFADFEPLKNGPSFVIYQRVNSADATGPGPITENQER